jgi:hypothetical protein
MLKNNILLGRLTESSKTEAAKLPVYAYYAGVDHNQLAAKLEIFFLIFSFLKF